MTDTQISVDDVGPDALPALIALARAFGCSSERARVAAGGEPLEGGPPAAECFSPSQWRGGAAERRVGGQLSGGMRAARRRAAEPRAASGSHNLENGTYNLQSLEIPDISRGKPREGQLGCKVTAYADGVRAVIYRARPARSSGPRERKSVDVAVDPGRSARSIARSRQLVVDRVRRLQASALWTFTKRGKFSSQDECWRAWSLFCQSAKRRFGDRWRYVAVPELHADGETWHLHVALADFFMVETLRVLWYRALGGRGDERGDETPGSVNVKAGRKRRSTARGFALYISKYIGKGFTRSALNRRVFGASVGIASADCRHWRSPYDGELVDFTEAVGRWLRDEFGIEQAFWRIEFREYGAFAMVDARRPSPS